MLPANQQNPTTPQVREALRGWHGDSAGESPLSNLYLYRTALRSQPGGNPRQATNSVLLRGIEALQATHDKEAQLLRLRFLDQHPVHYMANHFNVAESTFYALQRKAIKLLADVLRSLERATCADQQEQLKRRLEPPTYVDLVGVEETVECLVEILATSTITPSAPWLVSLEGIGGIGKTSLADYLLRRIIGGHCYDEVGWISARQDRMGLDGSIAHEEKPALTGKALIEALARQLMPLVATDQHRPDDLLARIRTRLKTVPHLIVIDNLETVVDVESLLPTLQDLANPTKFLLTTRESLYAVPNVYHVKVPELPLADAVTLLRREARLRNLPVLCSSPDDVLHSIYDVVGGNPLALRLVVGQMHIHALDSILADLRETAGQPVENLYAFIYRRAWQQLDAASRDVLLVMPLVNPLGDELNIIAQIGELAVESVRRVLNQLVTLNLVDARGGLNDRRYSIHGLTRTFLHRDILGWA